MEKEKFYFYDFVICQKIGKKEKELGSAKLLIKFIGDFRENRSLIWDTEKTDLIIFFDNKYYQFEKPVFCQSKLANYDSMKSYMTDIKNFIIGFFEDQDKNFRNLEIQKKDYRFIMF